MTMERPARIRIYVGCPQMTWTEPTYGRSRPCPVPIRLLEDDLGRPRRPPGLDHLRRAQSGRQTPSVDRWFHDEPSVRRFVSGLGTPARVRLCYEAGPTGYDLARLLGRLGVATQVIAPSLIPVVPGAKVKTDARDARRLVHLYRAGELTAVHLPTPTEEAIRDLARTRADLVIDRTRSRHRLSKFLLRHGQVYRGGVQWTMGHEAWIRQLHFDDAALTQTLSHYRAVVAGLDAHLAAVESDLKGYLDQGPFAAAVARLCAYRGVTELGALTLSAEVGDWRRFPRATSLMGFCGLVPSEYSSGERTSVAGSPKPATSTCVASLSRPPGPISIARPSADHQEAPGARSPRDRRSSLAAQLHLCGKFRRLAGARARARSW